MKLLNFDLYLVTDRQEMTFNKLLKKVEQAVMGGVTIVQFREKNLSTKEFIELGRELKLLLDYYKIPLLINDRVDVAIAINAFGVHLGQSDMSPNKARDMLGDDAIIGLSVETLAQVNKANKMPLDYIAVSPVFPSKTKLDTKAPLGLDGLETMVQHSCIPVVAIGGIDLENMMSVKKTGVNGIAVSSAILKKSNPRKAAELLITAFY